MRYRSFRRGGGRALLSMSRDERLRRQNEMLKAIRKATHATDTTDTTPEAAMKSPTQPELFS